MQIFRVTGQVFLAAALMLTAGVAHAQDFDNDGSPDAVDGFPCDGTVAAAYYYPGEGVFSTLVFEDNWPESGDIDFNDAVLSVNMTVRALSGGLASGLDVVLRVEAAGGIDRNGLSLHLPAAAGSAASITRTMNGATTNLTPWSGEPNLVFTIFNDVREGLSSQQNGVINANVNQAYVTPYEVLVSVQFATPVAIDPTRMPYDLFFHRSTDRTHQVHMPNYAGTAIMNASLFGTGDDATVAGGPSFVDRNGLPWVLVLPAQTYWPSESQSIDRLFPQIGAWATAGGAVATGFFQPQNEDPAFAYHVGAGVTLWDGSLSTVTPLVPSRTCVDGQWQPTFGWSLFAIHAFLLPTAEVMTWGYLGWISTIWNPATGTFRDPSESRFDKWCSGHTLMPDGRILAAGGAQPWIGPEGGLSQHWVDIYDPIANTWTPAPDMIGGRWYPTQTILPSGEILVVSGSMLPNNWSNPDHQVFVPGPDVWRNLTTAQMAIDIYPYMYVAPNGLVFYAGPRAASFYLDWRGTGQWTQFPATVTPSHDYFRDDGSSAMYAPGQIITMGGGYPPVATAEVINLNDPNPQWRHVAPMAYPRRMIDATILPDGTILVSGGTESPGFTDAFFYDGSPAYVLTSELWDPATETFTEVDSTSVYHLYHSSQILLQDGRVLMNAGENHDNFNYVFNYESEIYHPPYLFRGPRPTIAAAPNSSTWGQTIFVETPDAASITRISFIAFGSVTHEWDMQAHLVWLDFTPTAGGLNVTLPANNFIAQPGYHHLFILNGEGVPSVGTTVHLQ